MQTYADGGPAAAPLADRAHPEPWPGASPSAPALTAAPATPSMVADQLDALLGEQLMPLRVRSGAEDAPHLLAVDASGEPVVVEIVSLLDEAAVVRALRHAGRAARMSAADLAEAYTGGADRFASHLAAFRLTVPATALLSTFVRGGARLLLVCSHVAPGVQDVLEFLLQPGWQVDVVRAQVVGQPDGSRVVELSPVSRSRPPERSVARPPWARDVPPDPELFELTPLFGADLEPDGHDQPDPDAPDAPGEPAEQEAPTQQCEEPPIEDRVEIVELREPTWASVRRPTPAVVPPPFAVPVRGLGVDRPDPALVAVAQALAGPAALVWRPLWAAEPYEALLHRDGMLEGADGARYGDVETMTRAVSGYTGPLDAWQAWHVDGPAGPSLAALAAEVLPDQF